MHKDNLVIAIGKMKPKGMKSDDNSDESEDSGSEMDSGLEASFDELVSALGIDPDKVDHEAGVSALKDFLEQCSSKDYDDSDDEDKEDEKSSSGF